MFQTKYDTSDYMDFSLVYDRTSEKKLADYLDVYINFSSSLNSSVGKTQSGDVVLDDITLAGLDNFFIPDGLVNGEIDTTIKYTVQDGDHFEVWPVSGYTKNLSYDIQTVNGMKKLNGGFYQGFFKIYDYPVEFFDTAIAKGWTANLTLFHNPTTNPNTLNELFPNNAGFIFYLGTRAENKFSDITEIELQKIKDSYSVDFGPIQTTLYTPGGEFILTGSTYEGKYNYVDGQYWTGEEKDDTSMRLQRIYGYEDLTDNAFGIRITEDGRIGYRLLTVKDCSDLVTTGTTTGNTRAGVDGYLWVDNYEACSDTTITELVTEKYKVMEQYTKVPVIKTNKYNNITIVFERYFPVVSICQLKYSKFRKGTLKIFVNGIRVLSAGNVEEVFPHELDVVKELQQAVPYTISVGGGTQGLYEAVYLDPNKTVDGVLEKFFAGTYTGSVKNFSFYTTPANVTMVREKTLETFNDLSIPINFGGRKIILY